MNRLDVSNNGLGIWIKYLTVPLKDFQDGTFQFYEGDKILLPHEWELIDEKTRLWELKDNGFRYRLRISPLVLEGDVVDVIEFKKETL